MHRKFSLFIPIIIIIMIKIEHEWFANNFIIAKFSVCVGRRHIYATSFRKQDKTNKW